VIGLACMAWRLACWQVDGRSDSLPVEPQARRDVDDFAPYSAMYYQIIDRITRGEKP
jgi:hypothetical protein